MSSGTEMPNKIEPGGAITSLHPLDPPLHVSSNLEFF